MPRNTRARRLRMRFAGLIFGARDGRAPGADFGATGQMSGVVRFPPADVAILSSVTPRLTAYCSSIRSARSRSSSA